MITADGLTLLTERGATAVDAFVFFPSVAEGASRPVDADDRHGPHPTRTAIRGIAEELGVEVKADRIYWTSLGVNTVLCEYGLIGWTTLDIDWEELQRRRQAGLPKDLWESTHIHAVPFSPPAVARFVSEHGPWSPFALVTLYHTLLAHFRWDEVDRAMRDIRPQLSQALPDAGRVT